MDENLESETYLTFNDLIPLPYKVLFSLQFGLSLWYLIVYYCFKIQNLNILSLLNLSYSSHNYSRLDGVDHLPNTGEFEASIAPDIKENNILLIGIRNTWKKLFLVNVMSLLVYQIVQLNYDITDEATHNIMITPIYHLVPFLTILYNFVNIFANSKKSNSFGQSRVSTTMKRILVGNINSRTMRTNDILISDSLTSYSKVINDLVFFMWLNYYSVSKPYNPKFEFIVLAIPGLIRMKQCWFEYKLTNQRQHIFNFIKYSTGLIPIFINLLIKLNLSNLRLENPDDLHQNQLVKNLDKLNNLWYLGSTVNSTYSFIWDIKMDWGFQLFEPLFNANKTVEFKILRPGQDLVYKNFIGYYAVIVLDFALRFLWILKLFILKDNDPSVEKHLLNNLGQFLFGGDGFSFGYTIVEILEILRRWLWCFLKLESDWIKLQKLDNIHNLVPSSSNIELSNINKSG